MNSVSVVKHSAGRWNIPGCFLSDPTERRTSSCSWLKYGSIIFMFAIKNVAAGSEPAPHFCAHCLLQIRGKKNSTVLDSTDRSELLSPTPTNTCSACLSGSVHFLWLHFLLKRENRSSSLSHFVLKKHLCPICVKHYSSNWMVTHRLQLFKEVQRSKPHDVSVVSSTVLSVRQVEPAPVSCQLTLLILSQESCLNSTLTLWISTTVSHCVRHKGSVLSAGRWTHIGPSICF